MSISIPQPFEMDVTGGLGAVGPVTIDVSALPKIEIGLDAITINALNVNPVTATLTPLTATLTPLTINPLTLTLEPVTVNPVSVSLAITQIPSIRAHLPADFCMGFSILGFELFSLRLCGEAQVITEPYHPNPCEICSPMSNG